MAAAERVPLLGGDALLIAATGRYRGMADESIADASLLGAIRSLPDRTVFVKMIGPAHRVAAERDAFLELCRSLEPAPGR